MKKLLLGMIIFCNAYAIKEFFIGRDGITYSLRNMRLSDKKKGHLELLGQLTECHNLGYLKYCSFYLRLNKRHIVLVIEDVNRCKIIASGTLFIERKLIHGGSFVGHIEDIVTDYNARGQGLGKIVVLRLAEYAQGSGCYKVILDCAKSNIPFYEKCGFMHKGSEMELRFQ